MSVFLFPGQGALKPGMGADVIDLPHVAHVAAAAREATGIDVVDLIASGDAARLSETRASQVVLSVVSIGLARTLEEAGVVPEAYLGFSLGQVGALIAAGALSLEDGFKVLDVRSRAMERACLERPGAMLALLGADLADAQRVCDACAQDEVLVCANINAPGQIVISGDEAAIERAQRSWKETGQRCTRLATAGAFHSPLMASAAREVERVCHEVAWNEPRVPVICNTDARPFDVTCAPERMAAQVVSPVQFVGGVEYLFSQGSDSFCEVGCARVLSGLVRRIAPDTARLCVGTAEELSRVLSDSKGDLDG